MGNTCYMNSFLQSLFLTESLRDILLETFWQTPENLKFELADLRRNEKVSYTCLARLFALMTYSSRHAILPSVFRKCLANEF